jgi:rhodanese-related sulfurtransferase
MSRDSFLKASLRDCAVLLSLCAVLAGLTFWLHPKRPDWNNARAQVGELDLAEIAATKGAVLWVDARNEAAYLRSHIPGAILLNEDDWEHLLPGFLNAWQPGTRVLVYCDSKECDGSQAVAMRLRGELALDDVYVLKGGWSSWQQNHR